MQLEDILFDSSRRTADMAVSAIGDNPEIFKKFLNLALADRGRYTMRAARVVQLAAGRHPGLVLPYIRDVIHKLPGFKTDGLKRSVAKLLAEQSFSLDEDTLGVLTVVCFKWLADPLEKAAMKVYAMDILYKVALLYPEIKPELISTIEEQFPRSTVAVVSHGKKITALLYKQKKQ